MSIQSFDSPTLPVMARTRKVRGVLRAIMVLFLCASLTRAQSTEPLSSELEAAWPPGTGIAFLPLESDDPVAHERLEALIRFRASDQSVSFEWSVMAPGASPEVVTREESVSFLPTAMTTKHGAGPTLFVAGYSERTGNVIVEEWTVTNIALGSAQVAGESSGLPPKSSVSHSIRKAQVLSTDAIGPVHSIVYDPCRSSLLLFEEGAPHAVYAVHLSDQAPPGPPSLLWDSSQIGFLANTRSAGASMISTSAPDHGGFVIALHTVRLWENEPDPPPMVLIMRDVDCDGAIDEIAEGTWETLIVDRGYLAHERRYFPHDE